LRRVLVICLAAGLVLSCGVRLRAAEIHDAVRAGNVQKVLEILDADPAQVNASDETRGTVGKTPLYIAIERGGKPMAELLIARGADVNAKGQWFETCLHRAAGVGARDIAELLVAKGANLNSKDDRGRTPLEVAVKDERRDFALWLIDRGASVDIFSAIRLGLPDKAKTALDADPALLSATDTKGRPRTPLHWAAYYGSAEIARLLLDRGADVNGDKRHMLTPIELAAARGHKDVAELLIAHGAELSLHTAASLGMLDKVRALLDAVPESVNQRDRFHTSALIWAAFWGHKDVVDLLLSKGAKEEGQYTYTALHAAAENGQREVAELLIAKGESPNASHYQGSLSDGVDLAWRLTLVDYRRPKEGYGVRPIHLAAQNGHREVVESLIARGAGIEVRDLGGRTPLLVAAEKGKTDIVVLLLGRGADVNTADERGMTPLHDAADRGDVALAELLIAKGADVNAKDQMGRTPLWWATRRGHDAIVEVLRKAGAKE